MERVDGESALRERGQRWEVDNMTVGRMTREDAQEWKVAVGKSANHLRILLFDGYERGAWEVLGYATWTDCVKALAEEFSISERHLWRLSAANETEKLLTPGSVGVIPEKHMRPLTSLAPADQPIVWQRAVETAPNGKVTAAHVAEVAKEFVSPHKPTVQPVREEDRTVFVPAVNSFDELEDEAVDGWLEDEEDDGWLEEPVADATALLAAPSLPENDSDPEPAEEKAKESDEYYTPEYIIIAARRVLGSIDLDPASCDRAQRVVQAEAFYTKADDGLSMPWLGKVWLNPPFSSPSPFTNKLIAEYEAGNVTAAILLVNNGTETKWGQALLQRYPVCFVGAHDDRGSRISFWKHDPDEPSTGNRYAQMVFFLGDYSQTFAEVFSQYGVIKR